MQRALAYFAAFTITGFLFAGTLLLAAVVLGSSSPGTGGASPTPATQPTGPLGTIEVHAFDLGFDPKAVAVSAPGEYAVTFVNDGGVLHDLTFADGTVLSAEAGKQASGTVTIPEAGLAFICSVPGHADSGMQGSVTVDAAHGSHDPAASASASPSMTAQQMLEHDAARTGAFPAETQGKGNVVLEPTILDDGTKRWELTASVFQWETEPGVFVEAWGYNGMVPGPQLRAEVGDHVQIVLHNELPAPTTIHSHGLVVPNDMDGVPVINQPAVMPGE
ncbi:MAG TPA: multicopper oxidase domain-containing protein, partial [Candidatus Limnocylindria bacterium]